MPIRGVPGQHAIPKRDQCNASDARDGNRDAGELLPQQQPANQRRDNEQRQPGSGFADGGQSKQPSHGADPWFMHRTGAAVAMAQVRIVVRRGQQHFVNIPHRGTVSSTHILSNWTLVQVCFTALKPLEATSRS